MKISVRLEVDDEDRTSASVELCVRVGDSVIRSIEVLVLSGDNPFSNHLAFSSRLGDGSTHQGSSKASFKLSMSRWTPKTSSRLRLRPVTACFIGIRRDPAPST